MFIPPFMISRLKLNSESEDFAESCKLFCVQRKFLSEVFPNRYAYLKRLIKD